MCIKYSTYFILFIFLNLPSSKCFSQNWENEYLEEVNLLRQYPKKYSEFIKSYVSPNGLSETDDYSKRIMDIYLNELKPMLDTLRPLPKLMVNTAAREQLKNHVIDTVNANIPHEFRWCTLDYSEIAENISINGSYDPRMHIIPLLLDESVTSRDHRNHLLDRNYTQTAILNVVFYDTGFLRKRIAYIQEFFVF